MPGHRESALLHYGYFWQQSAQVYWYPWPRANRYPAASRSFHFPALHRWGIWMRLDYVRGSELSPCWKSGSGTAHPEQQNWHPPPRKHYNLCNSWLRCTLRRNKYPRRSACLRLACLAHGMWHPLQPEPRGLRSPSPRKGGRSGTCPWQKPGLPPAPIGFPRRSV